MTSAPVTLSDDLRLLAERVARNPHEPLAHRIAARAMLRAEAQHVLKDAIAAFRAYLPDDRRSARPDDEEMPEDPSAVADGGSDDHAMLPQTVSRATGFAAIAAEYDALFAAMHPLPDWRDRIEAARLAVIANRDRYQPVAQATGVPWAFIAIVHRLESGGDFSRHLHNGDPLTARTVNVPAGRPTSGQPPFTWGQSAEDALRGQALDGDVAWTLARFLFELERYNGFGYRFRGLATPYLWSGSDRYSHGKFVRDGVFDPAAVSRQIGGAVILRALQAAGDTDPLPAT